MKKLYLFAALAAMLAACSENDLTAEKQVVQQNAEEGAVQFSAYMSRGTTRAGWAGTLTTSDGTNNLKTEGFGVFGYYTNDELYSQNAKPEFFYNQKVSYTSGWTYSPIKYWPNEFGATAESQAEDRLTFFAYAPYVPVNINTGIAQQTKDGLGNPIDELETGILSLTRNTALGDPYVKYYASFDPEKCVDLCFGVAKERFTSSVDGDYNDVDAGTPYIDVKKPKLSDRIYFDFKHALAQLNVQIDADVDEMSHGDKTMTDKTKIYVREVTFEGFADKGMLNLNSEATGVDYTPKWVDLSGINEIKSGKVTIYDGRRDGREGQVNASASNEKPQNLNPEIISNQGNTKPGVPTTDFVNLFDSDSKGASILVIPTGDQLSVTIVYDVETQDDNLAPFLSDGQTHGSTVENKITKSITLNNNALILAAGKSYIVKLHLGMTSVKFDASVTEWQTPAEETDADLPVNTPSNIVSAGGSATITVPALGTEGLLRVTGLTENTTTTYKTKMTNVTGTPADDTNVPTDASGNADVNYTIDANTKPVNITDGTLEIKDGSTVKATLNIQQQACPLGLKVNGIDDVSSESRVITLFANTATGMENTHWTGATITVNRNRGGVSKNLVKTTNFAVAGSGQTGTLTLESVDKMEPGDVYSITVTAGDAAPETVTFTVGGIKFAPVSVEYGHNTDKLVPQYYGSAPSPSGYTGCTTSTTHARAKAANDNTIETLAAGGPDNISVTATPTSTTTPAGYFYSAATNTATCAVTVTPANATISYIREDNKGTDGNGYNKSTAAGNVGVFVATLKNSQGDVLTPGAAAGGNVTYSIVSVTEDGNNIATSTFDITTTPGTLKHDGDLTSGHKYVITLQASVAANANASYNNGTATTVVEFTAVAP